jgi:TfoX/Sxy family transcriptional regulator of competence genes
MNYYKIPENILEDKEELNLWIEKSLQVESKTKKTIKNKDLEKKVLEYLKIIPF